MREIAMFGEDFGHQEIVGALVERLARESGLEIRVEWRNARHGHGKVAGELQEYLRDLKRQAGQLPDLIIVATDANCQGLNERIKELNDPEAPAPMILAIPDPHVERWLLLDGAAFKTVFGRGCDAPDLKCSRDRYKQRLVESIMEAGVEPTLAGVEFAEEIVREMDLERASKADASLRRFIEELRAVMRDWKR